MKAALLAFVALTLSSAIALACGGSLDTIHHDHRTTAKICIEPTWHGLLSGTAEGTARAFLASRHDHFGLSGDLAEIELSNERESLTARHVTFQQMLKGLPIEGAEVIVSIAKQDGRIMRTFNNIFPWSPPNSRAARIHFSFSSAVVKYVLILLTSILEK